MLFVIILFFHSLFYVVCTCYQYEINLYLFILCSTVPSPWKSTNVVPIHKKGDKHNVQNYRPISLLPIVSKIMERVIFETLYTHVKDSLHSLQHGFIRGRSCTTQLLLVYQSIGSTLDRGGQVDVVFLDFSKAFDCISHQLLLHKLRMQYGIDDVLLSWLASYLSSRTQRVLIDGKMSNFIPVTSGVPQGSILGPLLFLLYINDMPCVTTSSTALFADDSKCFRNIESIDDCHALQNDLDNLYSWSNEWKMTFNPTKCKVMSVTRARNPLRFNYKLNNVSLDYVSVFTDLGVTLDFKLDFSNHVQNITSKASRVCGMIKRAIGFNAPTSVKLSLFKTYSRSILETSCQVWSPHFKTSIVKIESVQRSMTKFVLNDFISSYSARCQTLEILPLSYRREMHDLTFAYKALNNRLNVDFSNSLSFQTPPDRDLRTYDALLLKANRTNTETFLASYFNRIPHLWNLLPMQIRSSSSVHVFKERLLNFYLTSFSLSMILTTHAPSLLSANALVLITEFYHLGCLFSGLLCMKLCK